MITQNRLKELLNYNPETGNFIRLVSKGPRKSGSIAGKTAANGYQYIKLDYVNYLAHRLAFLFMTGSIPVEVDHKDQNPSNNIWANLRPSTSRMNKENRNVNNITIGVGKHTRSGKWIARGSSEHTGKQPYLGLYTTHFAASYARWQHDLINPPKVN